MQLREKVLKDGAGCAFGINEEKRRLCGNGEQCMARLEYAKVDLPLHTALYEVLLESDEWRNNNSNLRTR